MRTLNPCSARTIAALLWPLLSGEALLRLDTPPPIQRSDRSLWQHLAVTGEIVVKFHDAALARLDASGNLSFNGPARGGNVPSNSEG